jgi:hypothetical protein
MRAVCAEEKERGPGLSLKKKTLNLKAELVKKSQALFDG